MSIIPAPVTQYLLADDFDNDPNGPVNSFIWDYNHYEPVNNPSYYGRTQIEQYLPSVSNGALQLTLQTYNPTGPGNSFLGSEIISNQTFSTNYNNATSNAGGIAFTAVAKLGTTFPGMVGGIFGYNYNSSTGLDNEIDFESLSNNATAQPTQEQTNVYSNQPLGAGNPQFVADPSLTTYQTYTMEWFPNEVLWFIDGVLVRQSTTDVPQGSMAFHLNFWAPDTTWADAYSALLQPTANPQDNTTYTFDVQSVSVARIEDVNTTVTINGTVADQSTSDTSSLSPFSDVVVTDVNPEQTETVTVTLSAAANGTLSNLGGGSYNATTGVYTDTGSAAAVSTALDGLVFTPTPHQVAPGQTVTTTFTIMDTDTVGATATDSTTTVVATATAAITLMILRAASGPDVGALELYDISDNTVTSAASIAQVGLEWQVVGFGDFSGNPYETDMLMRATSGPDAGAFEVYDISHNTVTSAALIAQVGLEWQVSAFGDFSSRAGETDMLMRAASGPDAGAFEVYDISNNTATSAASIAQVGLEWTVAGFGNFSGNANETDMLLRATSGPNTGAFEVYDISHNAVTSAAAMGAVGLEWTVAGFGDFSSNPGETDMLMRNSNTGAFEVYDISHNVITFAAPMGTVGSEWTVAGFGDLSGKPNESDMLMRAVSGSDAGDFEYYDISNNQITDAGPMGHVGLEWQVAGIAADPQGAASAAGSIAHLVQAMASFGASAAVTSAPGAIPSGADQSQETLLTLAQHA